MTTNSLRMRSKNEHPVLRDSNHFGKSFLGMRFRALSLKEHSHTTKVRGPGPIHLLDANSRVPTITHQPALGRKLESVDFSLCHKMLLTSISIDCGTTVHRHG